MELNNFFIEFHHGDQAELAEVKPCCQENNVYYYDVYIKNRYQFTVTPAVDDEDGFQWKIALKNADNHVEPALVEAIGEQIEKHLFDAHL